MGDSWALPNKNYVVEVFETDHVVPSQGYVIKSTKRKLKPEYLVSPAGVP